MNNKSAIYGSTGNDARLADHLIFRLISHVISRYPIPYTNLKVKCHPVADISEILGGMGILCHIAGM